MTSQDKYLTGILWIPCFKTILFRSIRSWPLPNEVGPYDLMNQQDIYGVDNVTKGEVSYHSKKISTWIHKPLFFTKR